MGQTANHPVKKAHFILYVDDQYAGAKFYSEVLGLQPSLNVPGMTEFELGCGCVLGLMPEAGIKRLLGSGLPPPGLAGAGARTELYLIVEDAAALHALALGAGASELSPLSARDWGHRVAYSLAPGGCVLAFAERADVGSAEGEGV
jgi:hypothetical protein